MARFMVVVSLARILPRSASVQKSSVRAIRLAARNIGVAILACLFLLTVAVAQNDPAAGIQPFSTQVGGPVDSVDLATSNIFIKIPVRSKPGAIPFSFALISNSHAYKGPSSQAGTWQLVSFGFRGTALGIGAARMTSSKNAYTCLPPNYLHQDYAVLDATGASHPLNPDLAIDEKTCNAPPANAVTTTDGSGYSVKFINYLSADIYDKSGKKVSGSITSDPDGNTISFNGSVYTDTLNTPAITVVTASGGPDKYQYKDSSGTTQTFQVNYSSYQWLTNFGCYIEGPVISASFPSSISVPGVGQYVISYEATPGFAGDVTGRISKITFPTGGYVSYAYAGGSNGLTCASQVVPTLTRKVYDNTSNTTSTWTYVNTNSTVGGQGNFTATETDPAGNQTVFHFAGEFQTQAAAYQGGCPNKYHWLRGWRNALKDNYDLLRQQWFDSSDPAELQRAKQSAESPITETDVYTSFNTSATNLVKTTFDATYGNVLSVSRYDWGASTPLSVTTTSYGSYVSGTGCASLGTYINDRPCLIDAYDGSSHLYSQVATTYSATGHGTSVASWVSGSTNLTTGVSYNLNGTVNTITDPNGLVTTLHYDGSCNSLLSTSTTNSFNSLTTSQTYDTGCLGAVILSETGYDGNPWTFAYNDPLWRQTDSTDPTGYDVHTAYATNSVTTTSTANGVNLKQVTTLDGLARPILAQTFQGTAGNYDTIRTTYDTVGHVSNVSAPFTAGLGTGTCTSPCTQSAIAYDALGRVLTATDANSAKTTHTYTNSDDLAVLSPAPAGENTKQRQSHFDGLGRLASVCEISSTLPGVAVCTGLANTPTGYLTSYTYNPLGQITGVTQGAQTRTYSYDGLGRITAETNPESGTTGYSYDSNTTCGSGGKGDLVAVSRAAGTRNVCFWHDLLHRLTKKNYRDGSAGAAHFVWDTDTVNGATVGQGGQVASGYTCPIGTDDCARTAAVTDAGIDYDTRGNVSSYTQKSPSSAGWIYYWDSVDPLGRLASLGIHDLVTLTAATWDGEGRMTSLTASSGTTPLKSATYGPFGPATVTYGSGDSDTFTYDNVGHVTNYQFNVGTGGQNYNGSVYWNSNGTPRHLLTTNTVPGVNASVSGSQIQYAYDDLGRLASAVDATNGTMSQTFAYDRYGNNTKSGSPDSWSPPYGGYAASTNRYVTGGTCGSGIAYDVDGNSLCDTFHTYTWDAEARLTSVDGKTLTRDAFGQIVEAQIWGTTYELLHSPLGLMWYSGQASAWGNFKLPGGGSAYYALGSIDRFNHPDWQGNTRLSTNATSQTFNSSAEYAPFGEDYLHGSGTNCCIFTFDQSFMSMYSGIYDTPNRELHPVQGRWIQPDPAGLGAVDPSNPQSWNRYAYVLNNPLSNIDPTGLDCIYDNGDGTVTVNTTTGGGGSGADCNDPNDNGYYVDGTVDPQSTFFEDPNTGDLQVGLTDANGNYGVTDVVGFGDPQSTDALTQSPSAKAATLAIANVVNNTFPTACAYSLSARVSVLGFGVGVNDTQSGTSVSFGPTAKLSNNLRITAGMSTNGLGAPDPGSSIRIGSPTWGLALNPTNGQVGGYVGREFKLFGRQSGATLTATVGKIGTNNTCGNSAHK